MSAPAQVGVYNGHSIPTFYNGVTFRSRLEARWAVFFDTVSIPWKYEFEGFDFNGKRYVPDFWLPVQQAWVEIKPHRYNERDLPFSALALTTRCDVWLFRGSPSEMCSLPWEGIACAPSAPVWFGNDNFACGDGWTSEHGAGEYAHRYVDFLPAATIPPGALDKACRTADAWRFR
jgi:hypothetical protein